MKLHESIRPMRAPDWIHRILQTSDFRDGGFSRVLPLTSYSVLKLTCCEATNRLLARLHGLSSARKGVPAGLPAVLAHHGVIATDNDGMRYTGWTLERLFEPGQATMMRKARALGRRHIGLHKPEYLSQRLPLQPEMDLEPMRLELKAAMAHERSTGAHVGQSAMALQLACACGNSLRSSFLYLADFLKDNQSWLDLLVQGNILFNMFGSPVLGDPVYANDSGQVPEPDSLFESRFAVFGYMPTRLAGLKVSCAMFSSKALGQGDADKRAGLLRTLGVRPRVAPFNSPEHRKSLALPPVLEDVWKWREVKLHLRENTYKNCLL